jgi:Dna[CI] antecedent DciA-like protein
MKRAIRKLTFAASSLRYNLAMEQASGILQRIVDDAVAQSLKRLPPEELPQAAWEFAAGRAVAEKTRVLGCEAQTLRVEVADANWRAQLCAMAQQYVARLRPLLAIERIEFEVAGAAAPAPKPQRNQKAKLRC